MKEITSKMNRHNKIRYNRKKLKESVVLKRKKEIYFNFIEEIPIKINRQKEIKNREFAFNF